MKKTILMALTALPLAAFAQGMGMGPGMMGQGRGDPERMEKRTRLARTLGLAEALDLEPSEALKLGEAVEKFDERRLAAHKQLHEAHQALRKAATGEKVTAAEVDQAIQKATEARAQIHAVDREILAAVTKGLTPEKKARAVLFLEKFHGRFGPPGMGHMRGMGMGRRGMGPGMGPGPGGPGPTGMMMGPGMGPGMMAGACPDCPWRDDEE